MASSVDGAQLKRPETGDRDRETTGPERERITYRELAPIADDLDELVDAGVFPNRSEAIRTAMRRLVSEYTAETGCVDDVE